MKSIVLVVLLLGQIFYLFAELRPVSSALRASLVPGSPSDLKTPSLSAAGVATVLHDYEKAWDIGAVDPLAPKPIAQSAVKKTKRQKNRAIVTLEDKLSDPEYLKIEWRARRLSMRKRYSRFFRENGLPTEIIPQIIDLLADLNTNSSIAKTLSRNDGDIEVRFAAEDSAREKLAQTLGKDLYEKFENYTERIPIRSDIQNYSDVLRSSGTELSDEKKDALVEIIVRAKTAGSALLPDRNKILQESSKFLTSQELAILDDMLRQKTKER